MQKQVVLKVEGVKKSDFINKGIILKRIFLFLAKKKFALGGGSIGNEMQSPCWA